MFAKRPHAAVWRRAHADGRGRGLEGHRHPREQWRLNLPNPLHERGAPVTDPPCPCENDSYDKSPANGGLGYNSAPLVPVWVSERAAITSQTHTPMRSRSVTRPNGAKPGSRRGARRTDAPASASDRRPSEAAAAPP